MTTLLSPPPAKGKKKSIIDSLGFFCSEKIKGKLTEW